jgi:hypothetical protein
VLLSHTCSSHRTQLVVTEREMWMALGGAVGVKTTFVSKLEFLFRKNFGGHVFGIPDT